MLSPHTPLADLDWVHRNRLTPLARLGLNTPADLAVHYPRRHEDRRRFDRFPDEEMERPVCLFGTVTKTAVKRFGGWKRMFEMTLEDVSAGLLSQPLTCRWFNLPYIQKMISTGSRMVVFGRPKKRGRQIVIDHPDFEIIEEDEEKTIHMNRIAPVHPAGDGVTPRFLRALIYRTLHETDLSELVPLLPFPKAEALRGIHFPESFEQLEAARLDFVREEFFAIQLLMGARRAEWRKLRGEAKTGSGTLAGRLIKALPFALTPSQQTVIAEIRDDLASPHRSEPPATRRRGVGKNTGGSGCDAADR